MACRVCLCSPIKAHPTVGFAFFPSRTLHAAPSSCSCCNPSRFGGRVLLGTTLCTFPEEPHALEEDFSFISQFSPNPQLSSSWVADVHCRRNFPFPALSSLVLPLPPVNVTPLLLIPALTSCFQLSSSGVQFISLILSASVQ